MKNAINKESAFMAVYCVLIVRFPYTARRATFPWDSILVDLVTTASLQIPCCSSFTSQPTINALES